MNFSELMKIKIELLFKIFIIFQIFSLSKITVTCSQINETGGMPSQLYYKVVNYIIRDKFNEIDGKCCTEKT